MEKTRMINKMILAAVLIGCLAVPISALGFTFCYTDDWGNKQCEERTASKGSVGTFTFCYIDDWGHERCEDREIIERVQPRRQEVVRECVGDPKGYAYCTQHGPTVHLEKPLETGMGFLWLMQNNKQMRAIPCVYRMALIILMGAFGVEEWEGKEVRVKTKDGILVHLEKLENEIKA